VDKRIIMYNFINMMISKKTKYELLTILKKKKLFGLEYVNNIEFSTKEIRKHSLPHSLGNLNEYIANCSLCDLSKTKVVANFSKGNFESKMVVVSINYDLNTGKLEFLDIPNTLDVDINDIYMTNILKCTVSKYKDNLDEEIEKCIGYLEHEISILNPKIIITFGNAFKYMMKNDDDILDISGNLYNYKGIKIVPLLDIEFISKNPSYKDKMSIDINKIKNIMEKQ